MTKILIEAAASIRENTVHKEEYIQNTIPGRQNDVIEDRTQFLKDSGFYLANDGNLAKDCNPHERSHSMNQSDNIL